MKEVDTLAEYLCLMIAFDPEALSCVNSDQAFFQPCNNILLRQRPCV
jgi:hypothetical protein